MSQDNFIAGDADGPKLVPVEAKEPTLVSDEQLKRLKRRAEHEAETTKDVVGPMVISPELLAKMKKKRPYNRKPKVIPVEVKTSATEPSAVTESVPVEEAPVEREWYCSTCRENISDKDVMRIGAGDNRSAIFCPNCQRSFGFQDKVVADKIAELIKNNPTK
jgi:hypothetical protein